METIVSLLIANPHTGEGYLRESLCETHHQSFPAHPNPKIEVQ